MVNVIEESDDEQPSFIVNTSTRYSVEGFNPVSQAALVFKSLITAQDKPPSSLYLKLYVPADDAIQSIVAELEEMFSATNSEGAGTSNSNN